MKNQTKEKRVLVTGCAGFIGWKVCERLLERGFEVIGVDNINDYYDPKIKEWRLSTISNDPKFSFHSLDIGDYEILKAICSNSNIHAIINLAARAGVRASLEDPWVYLDTNMKGTLNLLECCKQFGIGKFILASTSSVYGLNDLPFKEEDRTHLALAPYAATKKAAEVLCYSYHYLYHIDITVFRYFTVYGPAGRPDMSIFKFIKNIDEGKTIVVFGDGKQKRDFTYIDDIAEGTIKGLTPLNYEIINLGNNNSVELMYVINLIEQYLNKKAKIRFMPRHPADIFATWADIDKAKTLLDWKPKTRIEEGLKNTIDWYFQNKTWLKEISVR